ncbi:MAG: hypothetical protein M3Q23_00680 [Actinomycetota bacterium]|nr:hypothetical protein [Actinomycetota bacterium]
MNATVGPELCRAPGCEEPLRRGGRGRPPLYCSPRCRALAIGVRARLAVELDHEPVPDGARPVGRVWIVRLRRGARTVDVASELSRPSADHLVGQLAEILAGRRARGGAME